MAYCLIAENPEEGQAQFERVLAHLRSTGPFPPEGQGLLIAGPAEDGWRSISVWDSPEALERFQAERLLPAIHATGCPIHSARTTVFEVHTLVLGDPAGAIQPT
jgi:hypothetical protein